MNTINNNCYKNTAKLCLILMLCVYLFNDVIDQAAEAAHTHILSPPPAQGYWVVSTDTPTVSDSDSVTRWHDAWPSALPLFNQRIYLEMKQIVSRNIKIPKVFIWKRSSQPVATRRGHFPEQLLKGLVCWGSVGGLMIDCSLWDAFAVLSYPFTCLTYFVKCLSTSISKKSIPYRHWWEFIILRQMEFILMSNTLWLLIQILIFTL